jgi:hypothetical protein
MTTDTAGTGARPGAAALETGAAAVTTTTDAPAATSVVVTTPPHPGPGLLGRALAEGVTGPAVVALAAVLVTGGALLDLRRDATLGLATGLAYLLAAVVAPAVVRFRSLATAAVLPPLLFVGAAALIARAGGQNRGSREVALDVATTLALSAPLLFAGAVAAVIVVLVRVGRRIAARR